jgi:hypothetical protein
MVKRLEIKHKKEKSPRSHFDLTKYVSITRQLLLSNSVYDNLAGVIAATGCRIIQLFYLEKYQLLEHNTHSLLLYQTGGWKNDYIIGTLFEADLIYEIWQKAIASSIIQDELNYIDNSTDGSSLIRHKLIDARFTYFLNKILLFDYHLSSHNRSQYYYILMLLKYN